MDFQNLIDKDCFNIWRYAKLYKEFVKEKFRLSLGEGWTKEEIFKRLNQNLKTKFLYFKREDLNPFGSFKTRGLSYQVSRAWQNGNKIFCLSSTGNAAVAASVLCKIVNFRLFLFLHKFPKSKRKRDRILEVIKIFKPFKIFFERQPTKKCQDFSVKEKVYNLTPSYDKWSSEGFKSIGFEIFEKLGEIDALFAFSSSGSSIIGIGESFKFLQKDTFFKKLPKLYPVQKEHIKRKKEVDRIVKESQGKILILNKSMIKKTKNLLLKSGILTSKEGIFAFSGYLKIQKKKKTKKTVIILSGKKW